MPKFNPAGNPGALTIIASAEPLAPWLGGKKNLAKRIAAIPNRCHAEPFGGMGGVFLRRALRPKSDILNDINGEIVNLFRVLREHPEALEAQFALCLPSREEFIRLIDTLPGTLTDIRRGVAGSVEPRLVQRPEDIVVAHGGVVFRQIGGEAAVLGPRLRVRPGIEQRRHDF